MGRQTKKDHRSGSLTRKQGTRNVKQSFLIVCEGVRTEPDYFKAFRMTTATVKAIGQAMCSSLAGIYPLSLKHIHATSI